MIQVRILNATPLQDIYTMNCTTIGKRPKPNKIFTDQWIREQIQAEHSTLECVLIEIFDDDIRGDVMGHIVRHTKHHPRYYCQSHREDWTGVARPPSDTGRMMRVVLNPIALLRMTNQRLCSLAMKETVDWMFAVKQIMCEHEDTTEGGMFIQCLGEALVPTCIYRGECPYGSRGCNK